MNVVAEARRRPARQALAEMHYRLRTERDTPVRKAGAVFIGVAIGCMPLYGLHLPLCIAFAKLAGVNRITTYLASHVNNPVAAPLIVYLEFGLGHWLFNGRWPVLGLDELSAIGFLNLGRDLAVGSLIVGCLLGGVLAFAALQVSRRSRHEPLARRLIELTARKYLPTGIVNWEFVRGKLKYDPLYLDLLKTNILPWRGLLLDLGCGRGILLAALQTAETLDTNGEWRAGWPSPPRGLAMTGIDMRAEHIAAARAALRENVELRRDDLRTCPLPSCEALLLLDVLFYLAPGEQQDLIARAAGALSPGGLLLIREADADAGWRFILTRCAERLCALARGRWRQRHHYRGAHVWKRLLESHGLAVRLRPMSAGTPYSNVLFVARKS